MKRSVAVLAASAIALSVVAIPVGAAVMNDGPAQVSTDVADVPIQSLEAIDKAGTYSDASLVGTGAAFLLLGIGTVSLAHRRRWRTIDLRDTADDLSAAAKQAS
jgi:hypothetical protein